MSMFDLMVKSAGERALPKRRWRRRLLIAKDKRLSTPIVMDRGRRQPGTKRSQRRDKVRAWQAEAANKNIDADVAAKYDQIDAETAMEMARDMVRGVELV